MFTFILSLNTKDLLALYNALTGKNTTKFTSREKGEAQVKGAAQVAGEIEFAKACAKIGLEYKKPEPKPSAGNVAKPVSKPATVDHGPSNKLIADAIARHPDMVTATVTPVEKKARAIRTTNLAPIGGRPIPCRVGSKQAMLLDLLAKPGGVTMAELIEGLSDGKKAWTEPTIRSGFGWDMKLKGYGVKSVIGEDDVERFSIVVPEGFAIPAHQPLKGKPKADARQSRLEL